MSAKDLRAVRPSYREFTIPKRSGGRRRILAPDERLKTIQRRILRRLLGRLRCHPAATGFERGRSIVNNAQVHVGKAIVVRMDLKDFFTSTRAKRVRCYFRKIGWNREASCLLVHLCTYQGGLPQGAPAAAGSFAWLTTGESGAYQQLGLGPDEFDLIFAYPWPDEERVTDNLFEHYAAEGAVLLTYHGVEDLRFRRKLAAHKDRKKPPGQRVPRARRAVPR
jgi:hypothetical protein